jgi:predicted DsbA family dithiol-disulfide isomerase
MRSTMRASEPGGSGFSVSPALMAGLFSALFACGSSGAGHGAAVEPEAVELKGVDTSSLTGRERREWSMHVTELLAPCVEVEVSLADCVRQARPCKACVPAASFVARQVALGKSRSQIENAFRLRFAPDRFHSIEPGDAAWKGSASARVVLVEWADFECPYCQRTASELDLLVKAYPGQLRAVFKHYPIRHHPNAVRAARAGVAAQRQGKFWQLHDLMFARPSELDPPGIERLAGKAGLDLTRFRADLEDPAVAERVQRDIRQADALKLRGTPMIFINGRQFDLEYFDLGEDLRPWIRLELELQPSAGGSVAS